MKLPKKKTIKKICLVIVLSLLLTGCLNDLDNPVADGKQYALEKAADIDVLNAEQARVIERENQDWENLKRTEKAEYWASIEKVAQVSGQFFTVAFYAGLSVFVLVVFYWLAMASGDMAKSTAMAYGDFVMIRSRLVNSDKNTGLRPQIMWQDVQGLPEPKKLFERFTVRHIREGRWYLQDTQSGEGFAMDEKSPANPLQLEIMRQLQLSYQIAMRQERSGKESPDGLVAAEIGQSAITLPDAGRVLLEAARENFPVLLDDDVEAE